MTDLTPNHPAVKAGCQAAGQWAEGAHVADAPDPTALALDMTTTCLSAALPHLTADDLRNTPAGRELMAAGWEAGVAQFARYGDVDANPYRKGTA